MSHRSPLFVRFNNHKDVIAIENVLTKVLISLVAWSVKGLRIYSTIQPYSTSNHRLSICSLFNPPLSLCFAHLIRPRVQDRFAVNRSWRQCLNIVVPALYLNFNANLPSSFLTKIQHQDPGPEWSKVNRSETLTVEKLWKIFSLAIWRFPLALLSFFHSVRRMNDLFCHSSKNRSLCLSLSLSFSVCFNLHCGRALIINRVFR